MSTLIDTYEKTGGEATPWGDFCIADAFGPAQVERTYARVSGCYPVAVILKTLEGQRLYHAVHASGESSPHGRETRLASCYATLIERCSSGIQAAAA